MVTVKTRPFRFSLLTPFAVPDAICGEPSNVTLYAVTVMVGFAFKTSSPFTAVPSVTL